MFLHMSVIHSVHGGGGRGEYLTRCPPGPGTPPSRHPPDQVHSPGADTPLGPGTPPEQTPPGTRYTPRDQVHPQGPGTPPGTRYTPRDTPQTRYSPLEVQPPGADPPPGPGTPPEQTPPGTSHTPQSRHPPGPATPPRTRYNPPRDQVHPSEQSMLGDTVNVRAVCILLECNLVF